MRELVTREAFPERAAAAAAAICCCCSLLLAGFRFIILSTAYIIPTYLQTVQNFRELQVGAVLLWIALPQLLIVLPLGALLKRVDARWVLGFGTTLIGVACLMATNLTSRLGDRRFPAVAGPAGARPVLRADRARGRSLVHSINPADALTIGSLLQISRLFGGEIGTAFMQTFVRVREQMHSNLIGLHVDRLAGMTDRPAGGLRARVGARTADLADATARAAELLAAAVAQQAAVLSFIDGFLAAAAGAFVCLPWRRWCDVRRPRHSECRRAGARRKRNPSRQAINSAPYAEPERSLERTSCPYACPGRRQKAKAPWRRALPRSSGNTASSYHLASRHICVAMPRNPGAFMLRRDDAGRRKTHHE